MEATSGHQLGLETTSQGIEAAMVARNMMAAIAEYQGLEP
jgi:hypothetical protein